MFNRNRKNATHPLEIQWWLPRPPPKRTPPPSSTPTHPIPTQGWQPPAHVPPWFFLEVFWSYLYLLYLTPHPNLLPSLFTRTDAQPFENHPVTHPPTTPYLLPHHTPYYTHISGIHSTGDSNLGNVDWHFPLNLGLSRFPARAQSPCSDDFVAWPLFRKVHERFCHSSSYRTLIVQFF